MEIDGNANKKMKSFSVNTLIQQRNYQDVKQQSNTDRVIHQVSSDRFVAIYIQVYIS